MAQSLCHGREDMQGRTVLEAGAKRKASGWLVAPAISLSQDFLFQTIHTFQYCCRCRVRVPSEAVTWSPLEMPSHAHLACFFNPQDISFFALVFCFPFLRCIFKGHLFCVDGQVLLRRQTGDSHFCRHVDSRD